MGVEHLDLVAALEVHAAVAPSLTVSLHLGRRRPFQMQLDVAEFLLGHQPATVHLHRALDQLPLEGAMGSDLSI